MEWSLLRPADLTYYFKIFASNKQISIHRNRIHHRNRHQ